jgi:hypothetical protein
MPPKTTATRPTKTSKPNPDADYVEITSFGQVNLSQNARDIVDMLPDDHPMKKGRKISKSAKSAFSLKRNVS